ncbi:MAG: hypothetical protein BWK80_12910 [Desulfobacteraceae bacterium IS3]|nr:MAG: hypothetical protein BWK80_12910 [Desulfobacteraceae bacterium IS3]
MDVEMVFNELSAVVPAPDIRTARQWMSALIETTVEATVKSYVSRVFRIEKDFFNILIANDYSLNKWLNDREVDIEQRRRFRSLTTAYPPLTNFEDTDIEDQYITTDFHYKNKRADGLGIAYLLDALALSFQSDSDWNTSQIRLDGSQIVHHACHSVHVRENADWLRQQREKNDPWLENGLPKNGQHPYIPPKKFYSHKLSDFKEYRQRGGFLDNKKQIWVWDKQEKHWDVQFHPYKKDNYFRVATDGRRLD